MQCRVTHHELNSAKLEINDVNASRLLLAGLDGSTQRVEVKHYCLVFQAGVVEIGSLFYNRLEDLPAGGPGCHQSSCCLVQVYRVVSFLFEVTLLLQELPEFFFIVTSDNIQRPASSDNATSANGNNHTQARKQPDNANNK